MTTFAGGWVVVPNTIDWDFVFANADFYKNQTLYITMIIVFVLFLLSAVWARRQDNKDTERVNIYVQ